MADPGILCILWGAPSYEYPRCCPQDTCDTDSSGDMVPVCTCGDDCDCTCIGCPCDDPGDNDD